MRSVNLANLHFCKSDKVRYRKHLTVGVMVATACGFLGTAYGIVWMQHIATFANFFTAAIWIWE